MEVKGQKRKLPADGELPAGARAEKGSSLYAAQRQSVLDISLDKFHRGQALAEPSLRRSVLIANTLRQIQEEIRQDGAGSSGPDQQVPAPIPPEPGLHKEAPPPRMDLDLVLDGSSSPGPQQQQQQHQQQQQRAPLSSIENLPSDWGSKQDGSPCRAERPGEGPEACRAPEPVFGSFEIMRSSYLTDVALDDLFPDIDTSVYEREAGALGGRTLPVPPGDELLKYLSSCSPPSSAFSPSPAVRDLNELEHIMEILVGS
ncbi:CDCA4 protein, partial [Atractosteus spatula]|nr:CDCA4 protein [Atractosteus spatula]MBN3326035.1 CDCA4 protein [Atractosteus spatula]